MLQRPPPLLSLVVLRQGEGCFNVASEELMRSWRRTEGFLLDARSHFSEAAECICEEELREFEDFFEFCLGLLDGIQGEGFRNSG